MIKQRSKSLNEILLAELLEARADASVAHAKSDMARAKADMVRAKIEAAGKRIVYDYKDGKETLSIADVQVG